MLLPLYATDQFLDSGIENSNVGYIKSSLQTNNEAFHVAGLINPSDLAFSFNNLVVTVNAPFPFQILYGNGTLAQAYGTVDGTETSIYAVNFASFVPGSGSQTVYLLATTQTVQQSPYLVIGPPVGHPDYDPNFAPYTAYSEILDTLNLYASLTPANNTTTFEIGRVTLSAGQSSIPSIDTTHQVQSTVDVPNAIPGTQNALPISQADSRYTAIMTVTTITSNANLAATPQLVQANASSGNITATLPSSVNSPISMNMVIEKIDSSSNTITVSANGTDKINGLSTIVLNSQYESLALVNVGNGNWLLFTILTNIQYMWTALQTFSDGFYGTAVALSANTTLTGSQLNRPLICTKTITVTLPAAATYPGGSYIVSNTGTGMITIAGSNIGPSALSSVTLSQQGQQVTLTSDGTNWWKTSGNYDTTALFYESSTSSIAASSVPTNIAWPTKAFDVLSEYNTTNGTFTPKESGYYLISIETFDSLDSAHQLGISISATSAVLGTLIAEGDQIGGVAIGTAFVYLTKNVVYYIVAAQTSTGIVTLAPGVVGANFIAITRQLP